MEKLCKTEKAEQKKISFEETLLDLMSKNDFSKISVTQICEELKFPRRHFYQYFSSKEELLHSMIMRFIEQIDYFEIVSLSTGYISSESELSRCLRFWKENERVLNILEKNQLIPYLVRCIADHIIQEERKIPTIQWSEKIERSDSNILFMVGGTMSIILDWYKRGYPDTVEKLSQHMNTLLISGCFNNF